MNKNIVVAVLITLALAGGAGFLGGMAYQKKQESDRYTGQFPFPGGNLTQEERQERQQMRQQFTQDDFPTGFNPQGGLRGSISGEILDRDEESITLKLNGGSSRIVFIDEDTQINQFNPGSPEDLKQGVEVFVTGPENNDGSIDARTIQIKTTPSVS